MVRAFTALAAGLLTFAVPPAAQAAETVTLEKTVAVDPTPGNHNDDACATTSSVTVEPGSTVVYCYRLRNNSATTSLGTHALVDDKLGEILTNFPYQLGPGASVFVQQWAVVTATTTNTATWTASNATTTRSDTAKATVKMKAGLLRLDVTVGIDPTPGNPSDACPTTPAVTVPKGTPVVVCYQINNLSSTITFTTHSLTDPQFGAILHDLPYVLGPGLSAFLTREATAGKTTVWAGTWTASTASFSRTAKGAGVARLPYCPGFRGDPRHQVVGSSLPETLLGTPGRDVICGGGGKDTIRGRGGRDLLKGGPGNDLIFGGAGEDRIFGEAGADRLFGGIGGDRLVGGSGVDILKGMGGADLLFARDGRSDVVHGGGGFDRAQVNASDRVRYVERLL